MLSKVSLSPSSAEAADSSLRLESSEFADEDEDMMNPIVDDSIFEDEGNENTTAGSSTALFFSAPSSEETKVSSSYLQQRSLPVSAAETAYLNSNTTTNTTEPLPMGDVAADGGVNVDFDGDLFDGFQFPF